jgi:hypothetical protein
MFIKSGDDICGKFGSRLTYFGRFGRLDACRGLGLPNRLTNLTSFKE